MPVPLTAEPLARADRTAADTAAPASHRQAVCAVLRCVMLSCCGCAVLQVIVAESYGGNDEPVDSLVANIVGVGAEVSSQLQCTRCCGM